MTEGRLLANGLLPGLPVELIESCYAAAPGNELASGKFRSPESSAALAANAFGFFLAEPGRLPQLPIDVPLGWPAVRVALEVENRFPWSGGRHPWLDVTVETGRCLVGIESKRYEPYRSKAAAELSNAYWRPVWGEAMFGYCRVRDALKEKRLSFRHLDTAQLVKHAFGLRTAVHRASPARRKPVLLYLYAEPMAWPDGRPVAGSSMATHRREIAAFAEMVAGDEVVFRALTYSQLLDGWAASRDPKMRAHAEAIRVHFAP